MMNFIHQTYIDEKICGSLVSLFNQADKDGLTNRGHVGAGNSSRIDPAIKESTDLYISKVPDQMLDQYNFSDLLSALRVAVDEYIDCHPILKNLGRFKVGETPILQHYQAGGGFKVNHFERMDFTATTRWLTWMTYLNTVKHGGGTYFEYQDIMVNAEKGKMLLWPTDFTHTHRGIVAPDQEKYIITGWLNFF